MNETKTYIQKGRWTQLTEEEYIYCYKIGCLRQKVHKERKSKLDNVYSNQSLENINIQGVLGEVGMCKLLRLDYKEFTENTEYRNIITDNNADFKFKNKTFDVKTVNKEVEYLFVNKNKIKNPADYYILMRIKPNERNENVFICFEGMIDSAHLFYEDGHFNKDENRYEYPVSDLKSFEI